MAKAKRKKKGKKAAKGKAKRKTARATKPKRKKVTAKRKKVTPKRKKVTAKRKGAAKARKKVASAKKRVKKGATAGLAKIKSELRRWQQLHGQLQEQIKAKDSTISLQMQEIMELKKALEDLRPGPLHWRP